MGVERISGYTAKYTSNPNKKNETYLSNIFKSIGHALRKYGYCI